MNVSGFAGPAKAALLYWAVISSGPAPTVARSILLKRGGGNAAFASIPGVAIGLGPTPCWGGDRITVFRGVVPHALAGNGLYVIRPRAGSYGSGSGQSPWSASPLPLFEGASLVLIGGGQATVAIYDTRLAGREFFGQLSYRLNLPISVATATEVLYHTIGADGQIGVGIEADPQTAGEITLINNQRVAGPGSPAASSDWNGMAAAPLPQLWDDVTHDVTTAAKAGSVKTVLPVVINAPDDCIVPVANIVSIE
jgi:hypothetical protein